MQRLAIAAATLMFTRWDCEYTGETQPAPALSSVTGASVPLRHSSPQKASRPGAWPVSAEVPFPPRFLILPNSLLIIRPTLIHSYVREQAIKLTGWQAGRLASVQAIFIMAVIRSYLR